MIQKNTFKKSDDGSCTIYFEPCTVEVLKKILQPNAEYVWIFGHTPNRYVQWWNTKLPLSKSGKYYEVSARNISYDLDMKRTDFLKNISEFEDHGIALIQSTKTMPDTLIPSYLNENNENSVLKQNGMILRFYLPHAYETAQLITIDEDTMNKVISNFE